MIKAVIFDLGGVLIDWNPVYLYRKLFSSEEEINDFLENVCTSDWNELQDEGRSLEEATEDLVGKYPEKEEYIRAYYGRWEEMLNGPIAANVEVLKIVKASGRYKVYALTNWSTETFGIAKERFGFLSLFDGIVVSGEEKQKKPAATLYKVLLDRYKLKPEECLFIDDNERNVLAARALGIPSIHYKDENKLMRELVALKVL